MTTPGRAAEAARAAFRAHLEARGHVVEGDRKVGQHPVEGRRPHEDAGGECSLELGDGNPGVLDLDAGEKLGAKSAEAARLILRAISRELDQA